MQQDRAAVHTTEKSLFTSTGTGCTGFSHEVRTKEENGTVLGTGLPKYFTNAEVFSSSQWSEQAKAYQ